MNVRFVVFNPKLNFTKHWISVRLLKFGALEIRFKQCSENEPK